MNHSYPGLTIRVEDNVDTLRSSLNRFQDGA